MRVLLIEDSPGLGEAIQTYLSGQGHAIDWVTTMEHGHTALKSVDYQLILLDLMLPDGKGTELLKRGFSGKYNNIGTHREGSGGLWQQMGYQGVDADGILSAVKALHG